MIFDDQPSFKEWLEKQARTYYSGSDPSHDWSHIQRVFRNMQHIVAVEGGDLEILYPAVWFHDVINPPKDHPAADRAAQDSAEVARDTLLQCSDYPQLKIPFVVDAITSHSFSSGIVPETLEGKILQDADRLEAVGAVAIMRTFASTGKMGRPFYCDDDPFCEERTPDGKAYALDLFHERLFRIPDRCHTVIARRLAERRIAILAQFLQSLKLELQGK